MDVSDIASQSTAMSQAKLKNAVEMSVLKMAIQSQGNGALQLVQSATSAPSSSGSNPSHLGNRIDELA
ncbi:MAG: YjfB family protein [Gammaproteobacteria bacterium]|nr:YjfB family protein [Gammaproteobacteria bacterium]